MSVGFQAKDWNLTDLWPVLPEFSVIIFTLKSGAVAAGFCALAQELVPCVAGWVVHKRTISNRGLLLGAPHLFYLFLEQQQHLVRKRPVVSLSPGQPSTLEKNPD